MSALIKRQYRGDPGIFSFIGKAVGGIAKVVGGLLPGPIGLAAKAVGGLLAGNGKPVNPAVLSKLPASIMAATPQINYGSVGNIPMLPPAPQGGSQIGLVNIVQPGVGVVPSGGNTTQGGTSWGGAPTNGAACEKGYHRNKTGYYSKKYGWVERGSVCVKNRRRNPLNPRALSRSMARLSSAKNAAAFLSRVTIRDPKGCGCR